MSAIREALGAINCINIEGLKRLLAGLVEADIFDGGHINRTISAVERARRALSTLVAEPAPARNCDRYATPAEAHIAFQRFCRANYRPGYAAAGLDGCDDCELCETKNESGEDSCPFWWFFAPAKSGTKEKSDGSK